MSKPFRAFRGKPQLVAGIIGLISFMALYPALLGDAATTADRYAGSANDAVRLEASFNPGLPEIGIADAPAGQEESVGTPLKTEAGSGALKVDRNEDYPHVVDSGETLSEIAYIYQIDTLDLAAYNQITNIHAIRAGDIIHIPSLAKEKQLAQQQSIARVQTTTSVPAQNNGNLPELTIAADEEFDGRALTVQFFIKSPEDIQLSGFEWDLGNGRKSFRPETYWTYDRPGTYRVSLKARLPDWRVIFSNEILVDVPHPTTYQAEYQSFVTLSSVEEQFAVQGELIDVHNYRSLDEAPVEVVAASFDTTVYRFTRSGYYNLTIEHEGIRNSVYVFVSPLKSIHVERSDLNWYRTQFNTGEQSNCGPSTVSMAIAWATGSYVPVSTVRQQVGWHDERLGATTLEELYGSLAKNDVNVRYRRLYTKQDLFRIIDSGNIAIVLFETGLIPKIEGHPLRSVFDRYYTYTQGHYVVVKGYTEDGKYLIVHDPIPSDWGSNSLRYQDGISMIGRNRYYPADTLVQAIKKKRSDFLEIWR